MCQLSNRFFAVYDSIKREDLLDVYTDRSFFSVSAAVLSADAQVWLFVRSLLAATSLTVCCFRRVETSSNRGRAADGRASTTHKTPLAIS